MTRPFGPEAEAGAGAAAAGSAPPAGRPGSRAGVQQVMEPA